MPYCAPSVNGMQCQAYSCEPSARGAGLPAQPGISSLVRRGRRPGLTSLNVMSMAIVRLFLESVSGKSRTVKGFQ